MEISENSLTEIIAINYQDIDQAFSQLSNVQDNLLETKNQIKNMHYHSSALKKQITEKVLRLYTIIRRKKILHQIQQKVYIYIYIYIVKYTENAKKSDSDNE